VIHAGYLTAIVPVVGQNLVETIKGGAPGMGVDEVNIPFFTPPLFLSYILTLTQDGWLFQSDHVATAALCFNSLDPATALPLAKQLTKHSSVSFGDALTYPGYKDVSVSWFFCEDDICVNTEVQQVRQKGP